MNAQSTSPALDLSLQAWARTYGDIHVIGTWHLHDDRPVLVLVPTYTPIHNERITPCVVHIDSAFQWSEVTGDPAHSAKMCATFARNLFLSEHNPAILVRIHNIINDCLGDLLRMGPAPRMTEGVIVADVIATDPETGKTIHEGTVTDHV